MAGSEVTIAITVMPTVTTVVGGTFTYDGAPHGAVSATTTGSGGFSATPSLTYTGTRADGTPYNPTSVAPTDAGTYMVTASYAGDATHSPSSASAPIVITKASASISVSP